MDDFRKIFFGIIIGFLLVIIVWISMLTFFGCASSLNCPTLGGPTPERTSIPTLVPATLPSPEPSARVCYDRHRARWWNSRRSCPRVRYARSPLIPAAPVRLSTSPAASTLARPSLRLIARSATAQRARVEIPIPVLRMAQFRPSIPSTHCSEVRTAPPLLPTSTCSSSTALHLRVRALRSPCLPGVTKSFSCPNRLQMSFPTS